MNYSLLKEDFLLEFGQLDSLFHLPLSYDCEGDLDGEN